MLKLVLDNKELTSKASTLVLQKMELETTLKM
jgi:hypothetical protein